MTHARYFARWLLALLVLVAGCAGSDAKSDEAAEAPVLDGVYKGDADSPYLWAGFHGTTYALYKADPECRVDYDKAPASCNEAGTFAIDIAKGRITYRTEAGVERSEPFAVAASSARGALTTSWFQPHLGTRDLGGGLVGGGDKLVKEPSSQLVTTQASLRGGISTFFQACQLVIGLSGAPGAPAPEPVVRIEQPAPQPSKCAGQG